MHEFRQHCVDSGDSSKRLKPCANPGTLHFGVACLGRNDDPVAVSVQGFAPHTRQEMLIQTLSLVNCCDPREEHFQIRSVLGQGSDADRVVGHSEEHDVGRVVEQGLVRPIHIGIPDWVGTKNRVGAVVIDVSGEGILHHPAHCLPGVGGRVIDRTGVESFTRVYRDVSEITSGDLPVAHGTGRNDRATRRNSRSTKNNRLGWPANDEHIV